MLFICNIKKKVAIKPPQSRNMKTLIKVKFVYEDTILIAPESSILSNGAAV